MADIRKKIEQVTEEINESMVEKSQKASEKSFLAA